MRGEGFGVVEKSPRVGPNHPPFEVSGIPRGMPDEKASFLGSKGDAPLAWKSNPPYSPLSGGYKKAMRPRQGNGPRRAEGVLLFLAPLSRGGRGGCFSLDSRFVIPAKAGIHFYAFCLSSWFPHIRGE